MTQREIERALPLFEGLIFETARQTVATVKLRTGFELEFDEVRQLLRIKVWHSVQRYNELHVKQMQLKRWVFMCVANYRKDLEKQHRRHEASVDDLRGREPELGIGSRATLNPGATLADWFDGRFLSIDAEQAFAEVEDELHLPSTLTAIERRVVALRMEGLLLVEVDRELGLSRAQRERVMGSLRAKLADWEPTPHAPRSAPTPPLPAAAPARTPARAALAV